MERPLFQILAENQAILLMVSCVFLVGDLLDWKGGVFSCVQGETLTRGDFHGPLVSWHCYHLWWLVCLVEFLVYCYWM